MPNRPYSPTKIDVVKPREAPLYKSTAAEGKGDLVIKGIDHKAIEDSPYFIRPFIKASFLTRLGDLIPSIIESKELISSFLLAVSNLPANKEPRTAPPIRQKMMI